MREKITPEEAMAEYIGCECDTLRKRVAELERGRCEDCGATLTLDGCVLCGAPVCCPQCCRLQSLADHIEKLQAAVKELEEALRAADGYENGIIREFEEEEALRDCVAELQAHLRRVHDRAHSWNSIPACSDIEQMAAQALGLRGGA